MALGVEQSTSPSIQPTEGLTSSEAKRRLSVYGPNKIPTGRPGWPLILLRNLWGPVPWLLEICLVLQIIFEKPMEAILVAVLLAVNTAISTFQEVWSWKALDMVRDKLSLPVHVFRDQVWQVVDAQELVPHDMIRLQPGDILPADVELCKGRVTIERVTKTGDAISHEYQPGEHLDAGAVVAGGEAVAFVTATGGNIRNRKTAAAIQPEEPWMLQVNLPATRRMQKPVFAFTRDLVILNCAIGLVVLAYMLLNRLSFADSAPFALILLALLIPAGLPVTFKMLTSRGISELIGKGALVSKENAIEKMAGLQVLCLDTAGLLTENRLSVAALLPYSPYTNEDVLRLAALASDETTQNPTDIAILEKAREVQAMPDTSQRVAYRPFNSLIKRWEAVYETDGQVLRVMKGFPNVLFQLAGSDNGLEREAARLASLGYQVLAVAVGDDTHMQIAGLIALKDPLRTDIPPLMSQFQELGVKVITVTASELRAAQAVAREIGMGDEAYPMQSLHPLVRSSEVNCRDLGSTTYAEAMPEDKVKLVDMYQRAHCVVGITGDGKNDTSALKQADVGIALVNATPAAQAAAGLVLTRTGLSGIIAAIQTSRQVSQQILAYSLTTLVMSLVTALFIGLEWVLTGTLVMTPHLLIFILLANSLLKMTILPARTSASRQPHQISDQSFAWLTLSLAVPALILCYAVFWIGKILFHLPLAALQTLVFILLVFLEQGIYYLLREREHAWNNLANKNFLIAPLVILLAVILLASLGILVHPIPLTLIVGLLGIVALSLLGLDFLKIRLFRWLEI